MLTLAYVRVSTEDQVEYSPEAQASRCRQHAAAHDLGPVTVIRDDGISGKNLDRAGIAELIELVEADRVAHVIVWRLDRLSRDQGDLNRLVRAFERHCVSLHSINEGKVDLSTAAGRMQIGVHGVFAQFYREHIVENVKMGMEQAAREGKWLNRPPTGYSMINGDLIPNEHAPIVRRIFDLRLKGHSYASIEAMVGIKYSTVRQILQNRAYLGLTRIREQWFPGIHEPLVTQEQFDAAHRGHVPGRRRGRHVLSGRVRCGLCSRLVAIDYNERAQPIFKCHHRGGGCAQPGRSGNGLERAALLGLRVLGEDTELQAAIRAELTRHTAPEPADDRTAAITAIEGKRRKLLDLHYADRISAELFADEEARLSAQLDGLRSAQAAEEAQITERDELARRFEDVATILRETDIGALWDVATHSERRTLVENLIGAVEIHPDHLKVEVIGAPPILVTLAEVGLKAGGTRTCVSEGGLEPPRPCGH
jgi:site-specific DNA recombinase